MSLGGLGRCAPSVRHGLVPILRSHRRLDVSDLSGTLGRNQPVRVTPEKKDYNSDRFAIFRPNVCRYATGTPDKPSIEKPARSLRRLAGCIADMFVECRSRDYLKYLTEVTSFAVT